MRGAAAKRSPMRLKRALILATALGVAVVIAVFALQRGSRKAAGVRKAEDAAGASLSIDKVNQTATKDGVKQWSLTAANARYYQGEKRAVFTDLKVTFFLESGKEAVLTAREGTVNTTTNDMEARGQVVVIREGDRLTTEKLQYQHDQRIFLTTVPVTLLSDSARVVADGMTYHLDTNATRLDGNVEGTFNEQFE